MLICICRGCGDTDLSRSFREFSFKGAAYRIASLRYRAVTRAIVALRREIEHYVEHNPAFGSSFSPVPVSPNAPEIVKVMAEAARCVGVGPMAAVAGAIAEFAIRRTVARENEAWPVIAPAEEHIVDNGGDIFLDLQDEAIVALYAGDEEHLPPLGLRIAPDLTPLGVCSSSSTMGHSTSLGNCELATVLSQNGALADAAATAACNAVRSLDDMQPTLERIGAVPGVSGVIIVKDGHVGMIGDLPPIERMVASSLGGKITGLGSDPPLGV